MRYASCCVLSYERPGFLATAITTLAQRAGAPFELIVHDDGSEHPEVRAMIRRYVDAGVVSTVIENPPGHNQGVGEAMRRMFAVATGDPIIKIDQDLIFEDGWLATVNEILDTDEADVDAHPGVFMQAPRIGALGAFKYWHEPVHYEQMLIQERQRWTEVGDFVGSFIAVPRAVYEEHGPFETHSDAFAEDWVFKKKLQAAGLVLGLPKDDIAHNQGFGIGPSTVVTADGSPHKIRKEPVIHAA